MLSDADGAAGPMVAGGPTPGSNSAAQAKQKRKPGRPPKETNLTVEQRRERRCSTPVTALIVHRLGRL
jgi:hypothetical protein